MKLHRLAVSGFGPYAAREEVEPAFEHVGRAGHHPAACIVIGLDHCIPL